MKVLLDTHVLLWWSQADRRLSDRVRRLIMDTTSTCHVSAVSAFEIATKFRIGKLDEYRPIAEGFETFCKTAGFPVLPVKVDHALLAGQLTGAPRDPFDRLIAAQAIIEGVSVLSVDGAFAALGAEVVW